MDCTSCFTLKPRRRIEIAQENSNTMGGVCSKGFPVNESPVELSFHNSIGFGESEVKPFHSNGKMQPKTAPIGEEDVENLFGDHSFRLYEKGLIRFDNTSASASASKEPQFSRALSKKSTTNKSKQVSEVGSLLGRASTAGLGKAVEVLDTLGSSMSSLNPSGGFVSGAATKGNKILILAFEVANTIVKGANLMQSLSKESVSYLKEMVLPSEGVQRLISDDVSELLRIAATDKRQELKVFSLEVVRFGNRCKDPQWHNLDRYFDTLESETTPQKQLTAKATENMQQLMTLVRHTADLYHEMHDLDKFELDYRRKLQEENSVASQRGDTLQILRQELRSQRKHVRSLKKKTLWSKILEDVMEKLVDIVHFLHLEIHSAFGSFDGSESVQGPINSRQRLGPAGLALHYANIITQIDILVSRSCSVPPSTRDALYQGLPPSVKSALRTKLQSFPATQEVKVPQVRAAIEKTLLWLVPLTNNTIRAHRGFGWVGEWANTKTEVNQRPGGPVDLIKIETLYHADKERTELHILDLVVWVHLLVSECRPGSGGGRSPIKSPIHSPPLQKRSTVAFIPQKPGSSSTAPSKDNCEILREVDFGKCTHGRSKSAELDVGSSSFARSKEDREMLEEVDFTKLSRRRSKSEELDVDITRKSSSSSSSSSSASEKPFMNLEDDCDIDRIKVLDVIDRVDDIKHQ